MDRDVLEKLLDEGLSLAEIGRRLGRHESTVGYWFEKYGLTAANTEKHAPRGGLTRAQLEPLVEDGLTIAEIALRVERSKATVRHWLARHGRVAAAPQDEGDPRARGGWDLCDLRLCGQHARASLPPSGAV